MIDWATYRFWRKATLPLAVWYSLIMLLGCGGSKYGYVPPPELRKKVAFSFAGVDENGLTGSAAGKVPLYYEFCIPKADSFQTQVLKIDTTLQLQHSPGRIGCKPGVQMLCIGNTHQSKYRRVVYKLAALPFVDRIERTYFE